MAWGSLKAQTDNGATEEGIVTGILTFDMLGNNPDFSWFHEGAAAYEPDAAAVAYLAQQLTNHDLVIFMGTWCEDSQRLIPQLYKILREIKYPAGQVQLYGLDRSKQSADGLHEAYKIEWVPTIIITQNGKELGRIVETVRESMEADLVGICRQQ